MPESDAKLLARLIATSGLPARQFAFRVMGRDERTIRRWLAGETMPPLARTWLETIEVLEVTSRSIRIRLRL